VRIVIKIAKKLTEFFWLIPSNCRMPHTTCFSLLRSLLSLV